MRARRACALAVAGVASACALACVGVAIGAYVLEERAAGTVAEEPEVRCGGSRYGRVVG